MSIDVENAERPEMPRNPIITFNDQERWPLLEMSSRVCQNPITVADEEAIVAMDAILDALGDDAAGLAAVQIGFPHRIFLLRNGVDENGKTANNVYINPNIIAKSNKVKSDGEACLSLPGMGVRINRPKSITLQYFDLDGNLQKEVFNDFWARAVMHEMDHLNGILITQRLEEQTANQPRRSSFGMKLTPHNQKKIVQRRAKNKRARTQKQKQRARANGR